MGPLDGLKVVEFAGIGPGPFAAMLLADLGAEVIRIERKQGSELGLQRPRELDFALRNRRAIRLDLKSPAGVALALRLVAQADALLEGFRPGVMERLGLGPEPCLQCNPRLVYGRITGWGQTGPLALVAGHDLNYIALAGALHAIGRAGQPPSIPLNLLGDYAGGSLYLVIGLLAALLEARQSGQGQIVDAAIVDGVASLSTPLYGMLEAGLLNHQRGSNFIDSGSHFYEVYECADGRWISIAPVEPKFYRLLQDKLGLAFDTPQLDRGSWAAAKVRLARCIKARTRDEWCTLVEGSDVCFAPVLDLDEAMEHPHLLAREVHVDVAGHRQPAPAPRFSRSVPPRPSAGVAAEPGCEHDALRHWLSPAEIDAACAAGTL